MYAARTSGWPPLCDGVMAGLWQARGGVMTWRDKGFLPILNAVTNSPWKGNTHAIRC